MIYTFVDSPLWYLQRLEKRRSLESPLKDQVSTLKGELRCMRTHLMYLAMAKNIPSESTSVISSVEASIINSTKDLSSACRGSLKDVGPVVCSMLQNAKDCKQEIRKIYAILWDQPWKSDTAAPPILAVIEFVDSVLDNLQDVLGYKCLDSSLHVKENTQSLVEELRSIGKSIGIIEKRRLVHQKMGAFLTYVQVIATRAACLSYFCWFDEINSSSMDSYFSDLMGMIQRCTSSDCVDMYLELLKASEDEAEGFVDFLLGNSAHLNIGSIREELMLVMRLSIELTLSGHCSTEDLRQISVDIKAVAKGAGQLRISRVKDNDQFQKTLSSWLQKMSLVKDKMIRLKSSVRSDVVVPVKVETGDLHESLKFQTRSSVSDLPLMETDHRVTSLSYSIHGKKLTEDLVLKVNDALLPLLKKIEIIRADRYAKKPLKDQIKSLQEEITFIESELNYGKQFLSLPEDLTYIIKAELFLLELRDDKVGLMVHMNDRAEDLQEGLRFLRIFLMNPPRRNSKERELMLAKSEATAVEAASVIFSLYENAIKKNTAMEMNLKILEVLEKIELLKMEIRKVYLQVPLSLHSNLPDGLGFISALMGHMEDVLNHKAHSIHLLKLQIEILHAEFESLKSFLMDTANQLDEHEELKDLWACIADVAYEAEYMIDSSVFGDDPEWYFMLWLPFAMEKFKLFKSIIEEISDKEMFTKGLHDVNNSLDRPSSRDYNLAVGEVVVGLDCDADFFIDELTRGSQILNVVPIIGPPGIGKTTLAKKIYSHPIVARHFHVQVWCSASQEYQRRELFSDILHAIYKGTDRTRRMDHYGMAKMLRKSLKGRRYLIVIDNLWHAEAWDDLKRYLPDDHNGSRFLLTSQLRRVAIHAKPNSDPFCLRLLSAEESWVILQKKIFAREVCPPGLLEAGKLISVTCKGIPLALVLMAGLLARTDKTVNSWKQIAKSSRSDSLRDFLADILELCYRHLPGHLKSCFLYFGAFPQGKEISVSKLFRLWMAEGFLEKNESRCKEETAEEYLGDLIGQNLVVVSQRSSSGGVKTCSIHDLLRDFCIRKAKEENFLQLTHGWSHLSNSLAFEKRRLCLCTGVGAEGEQSIVSKPSTACVRSLLYPVFPDMNPELQEYVAINSCKFRLLTVLDLGSINIGKSFPTGLLKLELLRYLAVTGDVTDLHFVPSSVANLWNLETLVVKAIRETEVELPDSLWNMKKLRHVHIHPRVIFNLGDNEVDCSDVRLDNVFTLSTPFILTGNSMGNVMRRFPGLRKLKCILFSSRNKGEALCKFPGLDFLLRLESLNISTYWSGYSRCGFSFPPNLRKLTLSRFGLPWSEISVIARLPNLETLKLLRGAFKGGRWDVRDGEFLRVKYLKLESLDLAQWNFASHTSFPMLEQLVIRGCRRLLKIPYRLGEIYTLQRMELESCGRSAVDSAKRILEEQKDLGNDGLQAILDGRSH